MRLAYLTENGLHAHVDLTDAPIVIGRSPEADLSFSDDKISRLHCGIRLVDGEYRVKDLGSSNGTYVNAERIDEPTPLKPGDHIRIGTTLITVESKLAKGNETILHEIEEEMEHGKGYNTILREIVEPEQ